MPPTTEYQKCPLFHWPLTAPSLLTPPLHFIYLTAMKPLIALLAAGGGGCLLRSTTTVAFAFQAASCVDRTSLFRLHSSTNAVVSVGEDAARDVESMNMWSTNMGIQRCDGCELTVTYEEDGFGGVSEDWSFVASQTIAAESPVLFVPSDVILSSGIVRNELYAFLSTAEASLADQGMEKDIPLFALFSLKTTLAAFFQFPIAVII